MQFRMIAHHFYILRFLGSSGLRFFSFLPPLWIPTFKMVILKEIAAMEKQGKIHRRPSFDKFGFEEGGIIYWWASWYLNVLGYRSIKTFMTPILKAMQACATLNIDTAENFIEVGRQNKGRSFRDYKLSRFACYLVAMNADARKEVVARAQIYFAEQVERINLVLDGTRDLERLQIREDIREGHHALTAAAGKAGVKDFRFFMTEGYLGLYNNPIRDIKVLKGIDEDDNLYEYMGRAELAANFFRISMTEERLRQSKVHSAFEAAAIHKRIGGDIRQLAKDHTGRYPEDLPVERNLHLVSNELRRAAKLLNRRIMPCRQIAEEPESRKAEEPENKRNLSYRKEGEKPKRWKTEEPCLADR